MRLQSGRRLYPYGPQSDEEDRDPCFTHDLIGYNFKIMEFQAALGITQLRKADEILLKRRENVRYMNKRLDNFQDLLRLPPFREKVSYLAYPIVIRDPRLLPRRAFRTELEKRGSKPARSSAASRPSSPLTAS